MKKYFAILAFPIRLLAYWLFVFALFRGWFWWQLSPADLPFSMYIFSAALPLDFSIAGYLMVVPLVLIVIQNWLPRVKKYLFEKMVFGYNQLIILFLVIVNIANIFLYREWNTLINRRAIVYLKNPAGLFDSLSLGQQIGFLFLVSILLIGFHFLYQKMVGRAWVKSERKVLLPLLLGVVFLMIRGGWGVMPINESAVYFSTNIFENHAATNPTWHLLHTIVEARSERNPFVFSEESPHFDFLQPLPSKIAPAQVDSQLMGVNVVLILMESMTMQLLDRVAETPSVCPNLERLAKEGLSFKKMYGSGYRTDQGLASVLSGYPALPNQSIILLEDKMMKLPALPRVLKENGYKTAFFYGGELTFANMGVYLAHMGFDRIVSQKNFTKSEKTQRWGVDDVRFLDRLVDELDAMPQPFFATGLTLSLHPPYDIPRGTKMPTDKATFLQAAQFADAAIGKFMEKAAQQTWFEKTLFVFVADHGALPPEYEHLGHPRTRQVPLIFYHPKTDWEHRKSYARQYGNHHDLPATLLGLLGIAYREDFPWSRNLWHLYPDNQQFAYYSNENGLGWATPDGTGFYHFTDDRWEFFGLPLSKEEQLRARTYLQALYDDYLKK